jgi:hypothetical protein
LRPSVQPGYYLHSLSLHTFDAFVEWNKALHWRFLGHLRKTTYKKIFEWILFQYFIIIKNWGRYKPMLWYKLVLSIAIGKQHQAIFTSWFIFHFTQFSQRRFFTHFYPLPVLRPEMVTKLPNLDRKYLFSFQKCC